MKLRGHLFLAAMAACVALVACSTRAEAAGTTKKAEAERIVAQSDFHGGLIVQVGCRDARLAVALAEAPSVLVQALVADRDKLEAVRNTIREAGLYGRVSAETWDGPRLPYADGMVNVLLVTDEEVRLDPQEIDRVLAPLGTAWFLRDGKLASQRKPWPDDVDQWSHIRYDATGNAVSKDQRVGPPRFLQWEASPRWNRGVKTSCLVSAEGRLFYILDDSHFAVRTPTWSLIARDASNGIQLWRHQLPSWGGSRGGKKVGPAQVNRRLVAIGDRVYATLGEFAPVSVLRAATGEVLRTLDATQRAEEVIVADGILVAMVNPSTEADVRRGTSKPMRVVALDPETGKLLWEHSSATILPMTLASDGRQVVYHDGRVIESLDLRSGAARWTSPPTGQKIVDRDSADADSPGAEKSTIVLAPQFAPTLVMYKDVVAFAGGRQLNVVSAADGHELWRADYAPSNYSVPVDLFGFEDCLWGPDINMNLWRPLDDDIGFNAYDPLTGKIEKSVSGKYGFRFQHHRCHQMKVVGDKVIAARAGIEFLDTDTGQVAAQHWTRGSCYYGVLPANGRLYVPPHDCACYVRAKLSGFLAMNSLPPERPAEIPVDRRLQLGPAFGQIAAEKESAQSDDWPTYRHDAGRSGRTGTRLASDLLLGWSRSLGGTLTAPVAAGGRAYVASSDAHTLYALDALTGAPMWQATLGSRIDSPPTIYQGLVLCGCRDGSVHALRAEDGKLAWRFLACPEERLIVSRGQLESVWPVNGSVLVDGGLVYFAAGRSSYLDGGLRLYGLEPQTGRVVVQRTLSTLSADGAEVLDEEGVDGYLSDILSANADRIFMRHHVFDKQGNPKAERVTHLHGPDGFLSGETTNRLLWTYAPMYTSPHQGAFYDLRLSRALFPSGRILAEGEETIYGYGQNHYDDPNAEPGGQWALFASPKQNPVPLDLTAKQYRTLALSGKQPMQFRWWKAVPIRVRAMVLAGDVLFVAGPRGGSLTSEEALEGKAPASLLAVSTSDGSVLADMALPGTPVWDGMAAAGGNLYLALADGQMVCLWGADSGRPGKPLTADAWREALPPLKIAAEPGLVGRWRFDEGAGPIARDCSGHEHDAQVSNRWGKGEFGACLVADAAPAAAVIPDAADLQFGTGDFTIAWWLKVDGYGARLIGKEAFPESWWVINLLDKGQAELVLGTGRGAAQSTRATTKTALPTDAWTHLVAVVDRKGGEVRWYMDGKLDSRQPIPTTMTAALDVAGVEISIPSKHKPLRGLIGDLRIYRQAIPAQRVEELYREESARRASTALRSAH